MYIFSLEKKTDFETDETDKEILFWINFAGVYSAASHCTPTWLLRTGLLVFDTKFQHSTWFIRIWTNLKREYTKEYLPCLMTLLGQFC